MDYSKMTPEASQKTQEAIAAAASGAPLVCANKLEPGQTLSVAAKGPEYFQALLK